MRTEFFRGTCPAGVSRGEEVGRMDFAFGLQLFGEAVAEGVLTLPGTGNFTTTLALTDGSGNVYGTLAKDGETEYTLTLNEKAAGIATVDATAWKERIRLNVKRSG